MSLRLSLVVSLALFAVGCDGKAPNAPISPSVVPVSPQTALLAHVNEAPRPLSMGADGGDSPAESISPEAAEPAVSEAVSEGEEFFPIDERDGELAAGVVPGILRAVKATVVGTTITLRWDAATSGGAPTTYVALFKGKEFVLGLGKSTFWKDVAPGRYLIVVFGRNAAGNGKSVTVEATVKGSEGIYNGSFGGTTTFSKGTCHWRATVSGAMRIIMTTASSGVVATIRLSNGRWTAPSPRSGCLPYSGTFKDDRPMIVSGTNVARTGLNMDVASGTFSGKIAGSTITGTLVAKYSYGIGSISLPVKLTKGS